MAPRAKKSLEECEIKKRKYTRKPKCAPTSSEYMALNSFELASSGPSSSMGQNLPVEEQLMPPNPITAFKDLSILEEQYWSNICLYWNNHGQISDLYWNNHGQFSDFKKLASIIEQKDKLVKMLSRFNDRLKMKEMVDEQTPSTTIAQIGVIGEC